MPEVTKEEDSGISFLGMFPKKERDMIVRYSNSIVTSRIESQTSASSAKKSQQEEEEEEEEKEKQPRCVCCLKTKNCLSSTYKMVKSNVGLLIILGVYVGCGALVFQYIEGPEDKNLRMELKKIRQRFFAEVEIVYDQTPVMRDATPSYETDSNRSVTMAEILRRYEDDLRKLPAQIISPVYKEWSFYESLFFCGTVITTIGYGNVTPATPSGRVATMIYGCLGIPLCLIFLSLTGKNLTTAIKYLWSFIRRFYFTGSCRKVRRMVPLSKLNVTVNMNVFQRLNSYLKSNRNRKSWDVTQTSDLERQEPLQRQISDTTAHHLQSGQTSRTAEEEEDNEDEVVPYEVDDNFNLPPIIALVVAFLYILPGAFIYTIWEEWSYLDSFYFTFISLSTIGFGDIIPDHPKFFLISFIYILPGLSLIAMVINVVMETVNNTITKASDSVFNFRKRMKSSVPALVEGFKPGRRMSI